ncbi:hypothetical protein MW887_007203 [Aspergillus wentii]|nr:hypothetical protein MW887_007203 [Aspergillus wentii]
MSSETVLPGESPQTRGIRLARGVYRDNRSPRSHSPNRDLYERQLVHDVDEFATQYNLDDLRDVIRKGAFLSSDGVDIDHIDGLTAEEVIILGKEKSKKLEHDVGHNRVLLCAYLSGFVLGRNMYSLTFPSTYSDAATGWYWDNSSNLDHGVVMMLLECAPLISSSLLGCWCTAVFSRFYGRRWGVFTSGIILFVSLLGEVLSTTWESKLLCRLLLGFAVGIQACTIPIYLVEVSRSHERGTTLSSMSMATGMGYFMAASALLCRMGDSPEVGGMIWVIFNLVSAGILPFPILMCPESPRWYTARGQMKNAYQSLRIIAGADILAARDLWRIHLQMKLETQNFGHRNLPTRFMHIFAVPWIRRATMASVVVMLSSSLSGIAVVSSTFHLLRSEAGEQSIYNAMLLISNPAVIMFGGATGVYLMDKWGRRRLLLVSLLVLPFLLVLIGHQFYSLGLEMSIYFCIAFEFIWALGADATRLVYPAEVFPIYHRELGMALSVCIFYVTQGVMKVIVLSEPHTVYTFGGLRPSAFVASILFFLAFLFVRETNQIGLEDMHTVFEVSNRKLVRYRLFKVIPYMFKRYILRRKVRLEKLEDHRDYENRIFYTDGNDAISDVA